VTRKLVHIQHDYHDIIISSQHIHIDHYNCLEVVIIRGKGLKAQELSDKLHSIKGLKHVALNTTTTGSGIV
jgi:CopG family nickel-responsive transcriptional regulator